MLNNTNSRVQYLLIAKLSNSKIIFERTSLNDPQILYESQEILNKFVDKKIKSNDKIKIKRRDCFYYITVFYSEYFFLIYAGKNLSEDQSFYFFELINQFFKDRYGEDYNIDTLTIEDHQLITNEIIRYEEDLNDGLSFSQRRQSTIGGYSGYRFSNIKSLPSARSFKGSDNGKLFKINPALNEKKEVNNEEIIINIDQKPKEKQIPSSNDNRNKSIEKINLNKISKLEPLSNNYPQKEKEVILKSQNESRVSESWKVKEKSVKIEPIKLKSYNEFYQTEDDIQTSSENMSCQKIAVFVLLIIIAVIPIIVIPVALCKTSKL